LKGRDKPDWRRLREVRRDVPRDVVCFLPSFHVAGASLQDRYTHFEEGEKMNLPDALGLFAIEMMLVFACVLTIYVAAIEMFKFIRRKITVTNGGDVNE